MHCLTGRRSAPRREPPIKALRSTSVTALHEAGVSLDVIGKVTGHAGTEVMRDHYLAVSAERVRPEFEAIASRLDLSRSDRLSDHQGEDGALADRGNGAP